MKIVKFLLIVFFAFLLQSCLKADEDPVAVQPISGETLSPIVGGAKQGNQVWVDLSEPKEKSMTSNLRTDWDLGLYSGDEFRAVINGSIIMAVAAIPNATDIDAITEAQVSELQKIVMVGSFVESNLQYIDNPKGNFLSQTTGIKAISAVDSENPIYLVNMGRDIYQGTINPGSVITGGEARGWMLLQITRNQTGYKLKWKELESKTPHSEYLVTKNSDYAFTFFSLKAGKEVKIQPKRKNWDIGFTVFTNEVFYDNGDPGGSYVFADFVVTNITDGVGAYLVTIPTGNSADQYYANFKMSDVDVSKLISNDQRAIGDRWRITTGNNGAQVYGNRFFVVRDAEGFFFKLRFNKMIENGERGHPQFEYEPL